MEKKGVRLYSKIDPRQIQQFIKEQDKKITKIQIRPEHEQKPTVSDNKAAELYKTYSKQFKDNECWLNPFNN